MKSVVIEGKDQKVRVDEIELDEEARSRQAVLERLA